MRPVHALLLMLPVCGYLFYRGTAADARLETLERKVGLLTVEQADAASASGHGAASPTGVRATADVQGTAALRAEVTALRARLAQLEAPSDSQGAHDEILDVVEAEQQRVFNRQLDFHQERWHEAREDVLEKLTARASLTKFQRKYLGNAMADEVDALAQLVRAPRALEDPEKFATDVMQVLDETSERVLSTLNPNQQRLWNLHRKHEREVTYPWLPR